MIRQIRGKALGDLGLVPRAVVAVPVAAIAEQLHIDLVRDGDDLDYYEGAALDLDGVTFAIMNYRGNPRDQTTVFMPLSIGKAREIANLFRRIAKELRLSNEAVVWRQENDDPAQGSERHA